MIKLRIVINCYLNATACLPDTIRLPRIRELQVRYLVPSGSSKGASMISKYREIFELAKPHLDIRSNEIHTKIAYSFAEQLLKTEAGNEDVVLPAILLHDVGWKCIPPEQHLLAFGPGENDMTINRIHEIEGARMAREILESLNYYPKLTDEIVEIILGHDSRLNPLSLNDAIVKDSDKLWRFSETALDLDPKRFRVDPLDHIKWLGNQIPLWFHTETAKTLAWKEHSNRLLSFGLKAK